MSYHLDMERTGKVPKIEMPPIIEKPMQQVKEQYDVHPELAKEFVQPIEVSEPEEIEEIEAVPEPEPVKETAQAKNFRQLKEQKERAERERDELMQKFHEMEMARKKPTINEEPVDQDYNINPDDLVEGKHLSRYDKKIKKLQEELETYKQQNSVTATEARLKARYPDLEKVISKENLESLRADYPELAETINSNHDLYNKAVSAYTLIKKLGIAQEDVYEQDRQRAQKNAAKPRPLASVNAQQGDSPLSKANAFANGLTDDLRAQLRREMSDARKGL